MRDRMVAIAVLGVTLALTAGARAEDVIIQPSLGYQRLTGWGQGNMDQANVPWFTKLTPQGREEFLDRLYTLKGDGLGLNICRTYITAGDAPGHAHMDRQPGGSKAPLGYTQEPGKYQWGGHEAALWQPQGAKKRGASMVAFWNSPPWYMTVSGCTSGAAGGGSNLRAGEEDRFAAYMVEVLKHYRDAWGIPFDAVSPVNEPEPNWWTEGDGQDGCHVDAAQTAQIVAALARRMKEAKFSTRIQAFEAAFAGSLSYLDQLLADQKVAAALSDITCHQYISDFHSLRRWPARAKLNHKGLWMSEWGDWSSHGWDLAANYARKIQEAHRVMQAEAWCMWEPSFLFAEKDGRLEPNAAYYAVAQFTHFVRPGMRVIEATDTTLKTAAYLDEKSHQLVIVTVNDTAADKTLTYDLSAFEGRGMYKSWRTSEAERLKELTTGAVPDRLSWGLPARSVTTWVMPFKTLRKPLVVNGGFETGRLDGWHGEPADMTGVQDNYPQGGSYDAFIDLKGDATGHIWQEVAGLQPHRMYALTAACATSGLEATLSVTGTGFTQNAVTSGGAYRLVRVEFEAPADGDVVITYSAGPAPPQPQPWATLDNVTITPAW